MTYWLSAELGITTWAAARYLKASRALEGLPRMCAALENGGLGIDKVVELTRFATPTDERRLIAYAQRTTVGAVRRRADVATQRPLKDAQRADRERCLEWWWADDGNSLWIEAKLRADQGMVVTRALERAATKLPDEPVDGLDPYPSRPVRLADALATLASQELENDPDTDRATVVVHADLKALTHNVRSCEFENGHAIHPETARRLICDGRLETVVYDGEVIVGIGRRSRIVPPRLRRVLNSRDRCCVFPGCPSNRGLQAHHIVHWVHGGKTELPNLVLLCKVHTPRSTRITGRYSSDPTARRSGTRRGGRRPECLGGCRRRLDPPAPRSLSRARTTLIREELQ